ncbi:hypothetical protein D3C80_1744250 [compost metagenome]
MLLLRLIQKRHIRHNKTIRILLGIAMYLLLHALPNGWMGYGLQLCQLVLVAEYNISQRLAIKRPVCRKDGLSEHRGDCLQCRLAGKDDLPGDLIGIDQQRTMLNEQPRYCAFSAGDAAG